MTYQQCYPITVLRDVRCLCMCVEDGELCVLLEREDVQVPCLFFCLLLIHVCANKLAVHMGVTNEATKAVETKAPGRALGLI